LKGDEGMEYMTMNEVAEKYKVSRQTVRKWIKEGKLRAERVGARAIRIKTKEVEKLKREVE
jgi:excisionase family DNA binding protein